MIEILQIAVLFLTFLILSLGSFYNLGYAVLHKIKNNLSDQEIISLSLSLGTIIFFLIGVGLSFLHLRWLFTALLIGTNIFLYFKVKSSFLEPWKIFKNKLLLTLIILGIITGGLINFPSGYQYKDGIDFWSSQGHDGLWHVSLMEEIRKDFPPQNPTFAGEVLYNYHYLVDILMGEFLRIYPFFSALDLYFRFFPVLFSLMIGTSVFSLLSRWQNTKIALWGLFFTYFVGSFGYIVTFIRSGNLFGGETVFWAAQQNTILGNPPHAVSHAYLASVFLSFLLFIKTRQKRYLLIACLIGLCLAGFKVSGGAVLLAGLGAAAFSDLIFNKNILSTILFVILTISNYITFKLMTGPGAESFLMFLPWWFIRTMVVDRLGWLDLEHRRQFFLSLGTFKGNLRVLQIEILSLIIFMVGNLGMRVIGFYEILKSFFKGKVFRDPFELMLITTMLTGFLIPMFFVQKGIIYNNIQFMQYFLFIFGFYGAISAYKITNIKKKILKFVLTILIVLLSLPTVIGNLNEFYGPSKTALARISNAEIEALKYLRKNSKDNDIILTQNFNQNLKYKFLSQPRPIYSWYSTSYVSAISARRSYLSGEEQILITGYPLKSRLSKVKKFFNEEDYAFNKKFLKDEGIDFVYISKLQLEKPFDPVKNNLNTFFENDEVIIYKVSNE